MAAPVMYILVNSDLKMTAGKTASQCCHVTQLITEELVRSAYESFQVSENYKIYMTWRKNCTKIVLKATEEELRELIKKYPNTCRYFIDDGETQIAPNSLTVVGFYPSAIMEEPLKSFKLL